MLMGFVDGSSATVAEISAKSTATALLFQQLCVYTIMPSAWSDALAVITADPHTDTLAAVIATRLAADSTALEGNDTQIRAALVAAAEAMLPAGMQSSGRTAIATARAAGPQIAARVAVSRSVAAIQVTSLATQSGIQVGANPDGDGIVLTNNYRRHIWYWVYVTGYQDKDGNNHPYDADAWVKVTDGYLSATNGLAGALGSAIDALWNNVAYKPVNSAPIDVTFNPTDAKKMYLAVVTAGAGSKSLDLPAELANNPNAGSWATGKSGMQAVTFVKDFMLPALFTFLPASAVGRMTGRQLTDFSFDMISLCTQSGFDASTAIASNDWWGALKTVGKGIATDSELRAKLGTLIATKLLTKYSSAQVADLLTNVAKMLHAALKVADIAYLGIDYVAVAKDCAQSDVYNYFTVTASVPPVRIEPSPATVHPAMSVDLTTYKGIDTPGAFSYHYTTEGKQGHLATGTQTGNDVKTSNSTVTYVCNPDAKTGATETVKVEVERSVTTDTGYRMDTVGSATVTITVTAAKITIDPDTVAINAAGTTALTAKMDGAVSTDSRIMYHWTNTGVAGHLLPTVTNPTNDYESSDAMANYVGGITTADDTVSVEVLIRVNGKSYSMGIAKARVTVAAQKVSVVCEPSRILASQTSICTASIVPAPSDTTHLVYKWTSPGINGHLTAAGVTGQDNIVTSTPSATYTAGNVIGNWQDTIKVEALLRVPGTADKSLGTATATIDIGTSTSHATRIVWERTEPWGSGKRGIVSLMFVWKKHPGWTGIYRLVMHGQQLPESSGFIWWSIWKEGASVTYGGIDPTDLTHLEVGSLKSLYEGAIGAEDTCCILDSLVVHGSGKTWESEWQRAQKWKATWAGTGAWWFEVSEYSGPAW